jgi:hypothetical protein
MKDEITTLEGRLKDSGSAIPTGMDHARILLYLEKLTAGRARDLSVTITEDKSEQSRLLTQPVTAEFCATWPNLKNILDELKQNKLYNRVLFMSTDYKPVQQMASPVTADANAAPAATASPAPASGKDVLQVHLELVFYAYQPADGQKPDLPLLPAAKERANSLFPLD